MTLTIIPLTLREANAYVSVHHRHNKPVVGHRYSIGVSDAGGGRCTGSLSWDIPWRGGWTMG